MKSPEKSQPNSFPTDLDVDPSSSLDRIIAFMDGIFAFAMTLLAINVDIPRLASQATEHEVTQAVLNLGPEVLIYVTSFLLVALYWQVNRRTFTYIQRADGPLAWLVIFQMLFVAFLPVATGLFDTYSDIPIVIVIYAGTLIAIGVTGQLLFRHARRAGLTDPNINPILLDYYAFRGNFTILVYTLVLVTGLSPVASYSRFPLILLLVSYPFLKHIYRFIYRLRHKDSGA